MLFPSKEMGGGGGRGLKPENLKIKNLKTNMALALLSLNELFVKFKSKLPLKK